jgi:hypothetical protein
VFTPTLGLVFWQIRVRRHQQYGSNMMLGVLITVHAEEAVGGGGGRATH